MPALEQTNSELVSHKKTVALLTSRLGVLKEQKLSLQKLLDKYRKKIKYANETEDESLALELRKEAKAHEESLIDIQAKIKLLKT